MTQHQWWLFLPAAILVAASPGAGNFLALTNGLRGGLGLAVTALIGRFAAFALMIVMVMLGVGALLATSAVAFSVLKWAGVAYLVWLGLRLWRSDALVGSRIQALRLGRRGARRINCITSGILFAAAGWLAMMKRTA